MHYRFLEGDEVVLEVCNSLRNLIKIPLSVMLLVPRMRFEPGVSLTQSRQDMTHLFWLITCVMNSLPCSRYSSRGF
jgi:hypothetical protein